MKRTLATLIGTAAALTILAACGGDDQSEKSKFPMSGLQTYETPDQIAADLNEGGFECDRFERQSGSRNAASSGNCRTQDEQEIIMMIFSSDASKQAQASLYQWMGERIGSYGFVEGGNWMVNCGNPATCTSVQGVLGGRKETLPLVG